MKTAAHSYLLSPTTYYFKTKLHRIGLLLVPVDGGLVTQIDDQREIVSLEEENDFAGI